jgi:N-acetylneuraminic acid mutarotase
MKSKLNLLAAGILLAAVNTGLGQPVITQQPHSCTNAVGTTATFSVTATGTEPLAYQWQKLSSGWSDLADCTATSLWLTNIQTSHAGDYRVVVSNADGAVTSDVARLSVFVPARLQFTAANCTVVESAGTVALTVQRLGDTNGVVSVNYATADGTATNGLKYTAVSGTLVFGAGETNQTIRVPILNNGFVEGTKNFRVILSNPTNAVLGSPAVVVVQITDNDVGLQFALGTCAVAEDAGFVLIGVVRGDDGNFPVGVDFATSDVSATNGLDYTATNGTLAFAAGDKVQTFTIPILNDGIKEAHETFRVTLSNPTNQVLGAQKSATVTVRDNDAGVQFQPLNRYWIAENEAALVLTVVRGNDGSLGPFTVDFATSNLTATAGTDYTATNGTLAFAQGELAKTVTVPILCDEVREPGEPFKGTLTNPTGDAALGPFATVTVTIVDTSAITAPGSWTQKADMPGQTSTPASCVVDGILYVMGGHYPYQTALKTVWAYDPQANSWTRKADMPTVRRLAAAAAVDGIIYVVGGSGVGWWGAPALPVVAYDPRTDTWVTKANIPTGRFAPAVCAVDGLIYAIGGFLQPQNVAFATVEAYDPKTDRWTRKRDLPRPIYFSTASVVDGVIYVFQENDAFAYDPQTDHWTNKARFSPWSSGTMSVTVDGIIYLFGGMRQGWYGTGYDFAQAYDPTQDRFSARRKMPRTRATGGRGVINGKIYLAGGVDTEPVVQPAIYWKVLDVFDPQGGMTSQIIEATLESSNRFRLVWEAEAGFRYGVQSTPNVAKGPWTRVTFSNGGDSVLATNSMVEVTCVVPAPNTNRFFRVLEL